MRILLDQGAHDMRNKGNNAMLQAAMHRLSQYWPTALFEIITVAPNLTKLYFPDAYPVSPYDLERIYERYGKIYGAVPHALLQLLFELREEVWHRWPRKPLDQARQLIGSWSFRYTQTGGGLAQGMTSDSRLVDETQHQATLRKAMAGYDLFVLSGGGNLYDYDTWVLLNIFDRIEAAVANQIPVVMVGQGVGSLEISETRTKGKDVLPKVDLICVRNRRIGIPTLESLGVSSERIVFTGDDAVEMAYNVRPKLLGTGIGVSLRVAGYTQIDQRHIVAIRSVLQRAATAHQAQLVAVPISSAPLESDISYIKKIVAGYDNTLIGWRKLDTPLDVIARTGLCRVMFTGTYHGAIFALAQGIPVVAVAKSVEYFDKLSELSDEFGSICQVFHLEDVNLQDKLTAAIHQAWSSAEQWRAGALATVARQIELQRDAYQRISDLVRYRVSYE